MKKNLLTKTVSGLNLIGYKKSKKGNIAGNDKGLFVTFALNPNKEEQDNNIETSFHDFWVSTKTGKRLKEKGIDLSDGKANKLFCNLTISWQQLEDPDNGYSTGEYRPTVINVERIEYTKNSGNKKKDNTNNKKSSDPFAPSGETKKESKSEEPNFDVSEDDLPF